jgi:nucleotide-binding universal stress UspA family protein
MATRHQIRRIVVGVDGSEHATAALEWAALMAQGFGSEVVAVFAISAPVYFDTGFAAPTIPVQYDDEWRAEIKKEFELVGRRGRGGVAELLLGSVSHELVLHSKRPVLVISTRPTP